MKLDDLLGKKTLFVGEVGSGKTYATLDAIRQLCLVASEKLTVLDFAPPPVNYKGMVVGGRIKDVARLLCKYISSDMIRAPRIIGKDRTDVYRIAEENSKITTEMLYNYLSSPTEYLVINDMTIHIHRGDPNLMLRAIAESKTFVGNAYEGKFLLDDRGSGISNQEKKMLQRIKSVMDNVVSMPPSGLGL